MTLDPVGAWPGRHSDECAMTVCMRSFPPSASTLTQSVSHCVTTRSAGTITRLPAKPEPGLTELYWALRSFPRSAWACLSGRSASSLTQSVNQAGVVRIRGPQAHKTLPPARGC
jgi:hypothetical protein